jgi:hypothetical protein
MRNQLLDIQEAKVEDMQNALKDVFGPMFEAMLKGEMNHHLGYEPNDKAVKTTKNRRNGYEKKTIKTSSGEVKIEVPRDINGIFAIPSSFTKINCIVLSYTFPDVPNSQKSSDKIVFKIFYSIMHQLFL